QGTRGEDRHQRATIARMGQFFRLHAHSRHGQGQGRPGARGRRHHRACARAPQSGAARREHEKREHQAQTGPGSALRKIGRATDRAGAQACAEDQLLKPARPAREARLAHLDSPPRTAQSDRMIAAKPRPTAATGPAGHPVLPALKSRPYPAVMGVLNVTPDSFSDGGQFATPEHALAQARRMIAEGADIIDLGAESTRPYGSEPISAEEELKRLQPVLPDVVALGIPVSIDSMKSAVVAWALDQGAAIANGVWGLHRDSGMAGLVAERGAPVIIMHNRDSADPAIDIMQDSADFFARSLD